MPREAPLQARAPHRLAQHEGVAAPYPYEPHLGESRAHGIGAPDVIPEVELARLQAEVGERHDLGGDHRRACLLWSAVNSVGDHDAGSCCPEQ